MLHWFKRKREWPSHEEPSPREEAAPAPKRPVFGRYRLLHKYLDDRHARTVVLTFAEIEDLIGFPLPSQARCQREWWTTAAPSHSDAWTRADRTAKPNLLSRTVWFERAG
jgi:hypothetical protein